MKEAELAQAWAEAQVANLTSVTDSQSGEIYAAFAITSDLLQIFSLNPEEDYEVNPNTIRSWRMIFLLEGEVLGYADYGKTLEALEPYTLAQENGSILVQRLTKNELQKIFEVIGGKLDNSLTL